MKRVVTEHTIRSEKIPERLTLAVASDLHSAPFEDLLEQFAACDALLMPGDLVDRHRKDNTNAERFLREVPRIVPVFFSPGNHEIKYRDADGFLARAAENGITLLQDKSCLFRGIRIGGLSSKKKDLRIPAFWTGLKRKRNSGCCFAITLRFTGTMCGDGRLISLCAVTPTADRSSCSAGGFTRRDRGFFPN